MNCCFCQQEMIGNTSSEQYQLSCINHPLNLHLEGVVHYFECPYVLDKLVSIYFIVALEKEQYGINIMFNYDTLYINRMPPKGQSLPLIKDRIILPYLLPITPENAHLKIPLIKTFQ